MNPIGPVPVPPPVEKQEPAPIVPPPVPTVLHRTLAAPLMKLIKFNMKSLPKQRIKIRRAPLARNRTKRRRITRP